MVISKYIFLTFKQQISSQIKKKKNHTNKQILFQLLPVFFPQQKKKKYSKKKIYTEIEKVSFEKNLYMCYCLEIAIWCKKR